MKINIGDLFLTGNDIVILLTKIGSDGLMYGYMSNEYDVPQEIGFAWLFNIEVHIKKDSWKHFPVKK